MQVVRAHLDFYRLGKTKKKSNVSSVQFRTKIKISHNIRNVLVKLLEKLSLQKIFWTTRGLRAGNQGTFLMIELILLILGPEGEKHSGLPPANNFIFYFYEFTLKSLHGMK